MKKGLATAAIISILAWGAVFLAGCGESRRPYVGNYRSVEPFAGKGYVDLELKENGEATWNLSQEGMVSKFKWNVEDNRIWFYTKEGGIIVATTSDNGRKLMVDLTGQWHFQLPHEPVRYLRAGEGGRLLSRRG